MKKTLALGFMVAGMLGAASSAYAQYPSITPEAQAKYKDAVTPVEIRKVDSTIVRMGDQIVRDFRRSMQR